MPEAVLSPDLAGEHPSPEPRFGEISASLLLADDSLPAKSFRYVPIPGLSILRGKCGFLRQ